MTKAQRDRMYMMSRYGDNPFYRIANGVYYVPGVGHLMDAGYEVYKKAKRMSPGARAWFQRGGTWGEHRRVEKFLEHGRSGKTADWFLPGLGISSGGMRAIRRGEFVPRNRMERELMEKAAAADAVNQLIRPRIADYNLYDW